MDRKTLTGFILIGAILLLWPSYLELISPSEKDSKELPSADTTIVEKYSKQDQKVLKKIGAPENNIESETLVVDGGSYVAQINNLAGGSIFSFNLKKHLKSSEESLGLIDNQNKKNLVVSFINQSGEVVVLDELWSIVSGGSVVLSEENSSSSMVFETAYMGQPVTKKLTFYYNSYEVDVDVSLREIKESSLDEKYILSWVGGLPEHEGSQDAMFMEGLVSQVGSIESFRVGSAGFFGS